MPATGASFGAWVRRRRRTLDLTQAQLAARVPCAAVTIRKIESDERRPSRDVARLLATALHLGGDEAVAFVRAARAERSAARMADAESLPAAPPVALTPIVGRENEMARLMTELACWSGNRRLVTLTGPPGVGKTRLALAAAARAVADGQRVVFVSLLDCERPDDFSAALGRAVLAGESGIPVSWERTAGWLRQRESTLLVLDNFESVATAAPQVAELVGSCPQLTCLVTSRSRLDLYGEHEIDLQPLSPTAAADLFTERARAAYGGDKLIDADLVSQVCGLLDHLPLAIELAARRTRHITVRALVDDLDARGIGALARGESNRPARQQTMDAAIAWTYERISPSAQTALRALSVFRGSAALEALAEVAAVEAPPEGGDEAVEVVVAELADQSLVSRTPPETCAAGRVWVLAVIRDFSSAEATRVGDLSAMRARHARHFAKLATRCSRGIMAQADHVLRRFDLEHANFIAALHWAFGPGDDSTTGQELVTGVAGYWHLRGLWPYVGRYVDEAVAAGGPPARLAGPTLARATLAWARGDSDVKDWMGSAVTLARQVGDPVRLADALGLAGTIAALAGGKEGPAMIEESLTSYEAADDTGGIAFSHMRLGRLQESAGNLADASRSYTAALHGFRRANSGWGEAEARADLAVLRSQAGDHDAATAMLVESFSQLWRIGSRYYAAAAAADLVTVLLRQDRLEVAARLAGMVEATHKEMGVAVFPISAPRFAAALANLGDHPGYRTGLAILPTPDTLAELLVVGD